MQQRSNHSHACLSSCALQLRALTLLCLTTSWTLVSAGSKAAMAVNNALQSEHNSLGGVSDMAPLLRQMALQRDGSDASGETRSVAIANLYAFPVHALLHVVDQQFASASVLALANLATAVGTGTCAWRFCELLRRELTVCICLATTANGARALSRDNASADLARLTTTTPLVGASYTHLVAIANRSLAAHRQALPIQVPVGWRCMQHTCSRLHHPQ